MTNEELQFLTGNPPVADYNPLQDLFTVAYNWSSYSQAKRDEILSALKEEQPDVNERNFQDWFN